MLVLFVLYSMHRFVITCCDVCFSIANINFCRLHTQVNKAWLYAQAKRVAKTLGYVVRENTKNIEDNNTDLPTVEDGKLGIVFKCTRTWMTKWMKKKLPNGSRQLLLDKKEKLYQEYRNKKLQCGGE